MSRIKDRAYEWMVRKNKDVQFEYEQYVIDNISLHKKERFKHWRVLFKLCWHYRVMKKSTRLIYKDSPFKTGNVSDNEKKVSDRNEKKTNIKGAVKPNVNQKKEPYPESEFSRINNRQTPIQLSHKLLKYDVISLDVFDTLLYRPFDRPEDLFVLLGRKLDCMNFVSIRKEAESRARDKAINREVDIYDIYEEFNNVMQIDKEKFINEEIEMEYNLCYANEYMKRVFDILVLNKKDIILISNMYLPENVIEKMLVKCGFGGYSKLFISNVYKRNKSMGNLFSYVDAEYIKGRKVIHLGDNIELDVKRPRRYGWDFVHIPNSCAVARRYRSTKFQSLASSIYKGIVGNITQNGMSVVEKYDKFWEFGFVYGGILVEGFCDYIQKVCKLNDIDRILFLARDGDIIFRVYRRYYNAISNLYMPWSRFLGCYVNIHKGIDELYQRSVAPLKGIMKDATIKDALIAMDCVFLNQYLNEYDLEETAKFDDIAEKRLYNLVKQHEKEIFDHFDGVSEETETFFRPYIMDSQNVAVIDIGWTGGSIDAFRKFAKERLGFKGKIIGITCGCFDRDNVNAQISSRDLYAYLFSYSKNRNLMEEFTKHNFNYTMIMETILTAAVPTALEICDEKVRYGLPLVENYDKIRKMQEGILEFVRLFHDKFDQYKELIDISSYDAYSPIENFMSKKEWIEEQFKDYKFCVVSGFTEKKNVTNFVDNLKGEGK